MAPSQGGAAHHYPTPPLPSLSPPQVHPSISLPASLTPRASLLAVATSSEYSPEPRAFLLDMDKLTALVEEDEGGGIKEREEGGGRNKEGEECVIRELECKASGTVSILSCILQPSS